MNSENESTMNYFINVPEEFNTLFKCK